MCGLRRQPPQIVCLGEALIDMVEVGGAGDADELATTPTDAASAASSANFAAHGPASLLYRAHPGGAPANVAVGLAQLDAHAAFVGKVGRDRLGRFLQATLHTKGVDTDWLLQDRTAPTAVAMVTVEPGGERDFSFYHVGSADTRLRPEELDVGLLEAALITHVGSVSMAEELSAAATIAAATHAHQSGRLVSLDVNVRPHLWPSTEAAHSAVDELLSVAHVVKFSEEDFRLLYGEPPDEERLRALAQARQIELLLLTMGEAGTRFALDTGADVKMIPGVPVSAVDSTGAGDAFMAGVLSALVEQIGPQVEGGAQPVDALRHIRNAAEIVRRGNAAGALSVTRPGGIPSMPSRAEVDSLLTRRDS